MLFFPKPIIGKESKDLKIAEVLHVDPSQIIDFDEKIIFNNYGSAHEHSFSQNNFYAHEAIKACEQEIIHLKEEIAFLRGLVKEGQR